MLEHPATALADDADSVRVVDDQRRRVLGRDLEQFGERGEITLHAEDAVGDDQPALELGRRGERAAQVGGIGVLEDGLVGPAARAASRR